MIFDWRPRATRGGSGWHQAPFVVTFVGITLGATVIVELGQIFQLASRADRLFPLASKADAFGLTSRADRTFALRSSFED